MGLKRLKRSKGSQAPQLFQGTGFIKYDFGRRKRLYAVLLTLDTPEIGKYGYITEAVLSRKRL